MQKIERGNLEKDLSLAQEDEKKKKLFGFPFFLPLAISPAAGFHLISQQQQQQLLVLPPLEAFKVTLQLCNSGGPSAAAAAAAAAAPLYALISLLLLSRGVLFDRTTGG